MINQKNIILTLLLSILTQSSSAARIIDTDECTASDAVSDPCTILVSDGLMCNATALLWTDVAEAATAWHPESDQPPAGIHVVMQVTDPIGGYGKIGIATAALWARSHGHTLSVHRELPGGTADNPTPEGFDHRFGKVSTYPHPPNPTHAEYNPTLQHPRSKYCTT